MNVQLEPQLQLAELEHPQLPAIVLNFKGLIGKNLKSRLKNRWGRAFSFRQKST